MNNSVYLNTIKLFYNVDRLTVLSRSYQFSKLFNYGGVLFNSIRHKNTLPKDISSIVKPITIKPVNDNDGVNVGEELSGVLKKGIHF